MCAEGMQGDDFDYLEAARRVFEVEAAEVARVGARLGEEFCRAADAIRKAAEKRGKVLVLGVGKSGLVGEKIAATFTSTGTPALVLHSVNALHGDLGIACEGDIALALSYGGETEELLRVLPALASLGVRLIAMTGNPHSSLARAAEIVLDVSVEREACPLGLAPTSSTTAMLVLGDALAMVVLEARGFRKEDFAKFHPGGSLGRALLTKARDIMRPAAEVPILPEHSTVLEVVQATTRCRAGAAVMVDSEGKLAGIFTQGDFARNFPKHPDIARRHVSEFMTRNPITIHEKHLAAEALHILRTNRIDDLVVVDEASRPVGLIDSQDLARLRLL